MITEETKNGSRMNSGGPADMAGAVHDKRSRIWLCLVIAALFFLMLPYLGRAELFLDIHTAYWDDQRPRLRIEKFFRGERIPVRLAVHNPEDDIQVDLYIGLLSIDGKLFVSGEDGWSTQIRPWMANVSIPAGLIENDYILFHLDIPSEMPPICEEGTYYLLAGVTEPGTHSFICDVSTTGFEVVDEQARQLDIDLVTQQVTAMALRARRWYQKPADEGGGGGSFVDLCIDDIGSALGEHEDSYAISLATDVSVNIAGTCGVATCQFGYPVVIVADVTLDSVTITFHEWDKF
ncbi:MAG: hypothetical protein JW941_03360 [Candidatus Coatesbacteria bacterium]|nr:hypothetical protein [Candidatus Coatesbacteria bacterium]